MKKPFIIGSLILLMLLIPPIRVYMESIMIIHMLVQLPLLIIAGWFIGKFISSKFSKVLIVLNDNGVPGIILFVAITMFWMLPRTLDEALTFPMYEVFKFVSLTISGILLRDSWGKINALGRVFVFLNYLSMFALMGWLYLDSPIQICNNYLVDQQKVLGWGFIFITAVMILYVVQSVFTDQTEVEET
jgi:hypothetical protein